MALDIRIADITAEPTAIREPLSRVWLDQTLTGQNPTGFLSALDEQTALGSVQRSGLDLVLRMDFSLRLTAECALCLKKFELDVPVRFDLTLVPQPESLPEPEEEVELSREDIEREFYSGEFLPLEDLVRQQILLSLPMVARCREDCRGLCSGCGVDRNIEACTCGQTQEEGAFRVLRGMLDK
jgi:uncharacterized protein